MSSFGLGGRFSAETSTAASSQQPIDDSTPWVAASDGDLQRLQQALQQMQIPVTVTDKQGYTLLQAAASYSQMSVLTWLRDQAQTLVSWVNNVDHDGDSALHYASTATAAQFLVEQMGIDVSIRNNTGLTALQAKRKELEEILEENEDDCNDNSDAVDLKALICYLETLSIRQQ